MPEKYEDRFIVYDSLLSYLKGESFERSPLINLSLSRFLSTKYVIEKLSSVPLKKLKKPVFAVLLGAISELLFSDSSETHAICDSAVEYVKKKGLSGLSGFVNAVTRRAAREKDILIKEIEESADPSIRRSLPDIIYSSLEKDYGKEKAESIAKSYFKRRYTHLFIPGLLEEPQKTIDSLSKKGFVLKKDDSKISGFYLEKSLEGRSIIASEEFEKGLIYLQDRSSMAPAEAFFDIRDKIPESPDILDLCAAPGGKSIVFAALTHDAANIVSCDVSEQKTALIRENQRRLHIDSIRPAVNDASRFNPDFSDRFDIVLCDVPCSGFGVIGRKPDIRYRHDAESLQSLLSLQKEILTNAAKYVKRNGFLIYSTCTLRRAENEDMAAFLKECDPEMTELSKKTLFPDEGDQDGFFTAVLQKGALS